MKKLFEILVTLLGNEHVASIGTGVQTWGFQVMDIE